CRNWDWDRLNRTLANHHPVSTLCSSLAILAFMGNIQFRTTANRLCSGEALGLFSAYKFPQFSPWKHHAPWLVQLHADSSWAPDLSCTMKVLLTTCLLFALLPAVASMACYNCGGDPQACRNPTVIECDEEEDSCVSIASAIDVGDLRVVTIITKTCVQSQYWHTGNYSFATTHNISITGSEVICQEDLCNRETVTLPRRSQLQENGRQCPACLTYSSDECQSDGPVSCRGDETKCLYFGLTAEAPEDVEVDVAFQGCATPNACNIKEGETEAADGLITMNVTRLRCRDAPRSTCALEGYVKASQLLLNFPFMGMKLRDEGLRN
ncbi:hypothetical protein lerEdw1_012693, partial [Lerista edwardsae]